MLPAVFVINQSNSCAAKNGLIPLNIFNEIFTDYFRHNLPLLLQILSSYLSLFGSSTTLNVKHDFSSAQTNKSESDCNIFSGVCKLWHVEMQKQMPVSSR